VTSYEAVQQVLSDPRFSRDLRFSAKPVAGRAEFPTELVVPSDRTLGMDGPDHLALRRLASPAFSQRRMEAMRPRIQQIADRLLADMADSGPPVDLIGGFAAPFPVQVICEVLGVPDDNWDQFRIWSDATVSVTSHSEEEVLAGWAGLMDTVSRTINQKRRTPAADLISTFIAARDGNDALTDTELLFLAIGVLIGGNETTANAIALGVCHLWEHPDQMAALQTDSALIDTAVEELLRWEPLSTVGRRRVATEEVHLAGARIQAGDTVVISMRAANRDERHFTEPERLYLARRPNPHLSFGHGPHFCLGASLARIELQVALGSLVREFPGLRPAGPVDDLPRKSGLMVEGLVELPVTW
jgi:cytochrome P450